MDRAATGGQIGWRAGLLEKTERLCDFRVQYRSYGAGVDLGEEWYLDVTWQELDVDLGSRFSGAKVIKKSRAVYTNFIWMKIRGDFTKYPQRTTVSGSDRKSNMHVVTATRPA